MSDERKSDASDDSSDDASKEAVEESPSGFHDPAVQVRTLRAVAAGAFFAGVLLAVTGFLPWFSLSVQKTVVDKSLQRIPVSVTATVSAYDMTSAATAPTMAGPQLSKAPALPAAGSFPAYVPLALLAACAVVAACAFRSTLIAVAAAFLANIARGKSQDLLTTSLDPLHGGAALTALPASSWAQTLALALFVVAAVAAVSILVFNRMRRKAEPTKSMSASDIAMGVLGSSLSTLSTMVDERRVQSQHDNP